MMSKTSTDEYRKQLLPIAITTSQSKNSTLTTPSTRNTIDIQFKLQVTTIRFNIENSKEQHRDCNDRTVEIKFKFNREVSDRVKVLAKETIVEDRLEQMNLELLDV